MSETKNLEEAITSEILRVNEIMGESLSGQATLSSLAAPLIEQAVNAARNAQASGDVLQMIAALEALRWLHYMPETLPPSHLHAAIAKIIEDIKKENIQRSETIQALAQKGQFSEMIRLQEIKNETTKIMWELEKTLNDTLP